MHLQGEVDTLKLVSFRNETEHDPLIYLNFSDFDGDDDFSSFRLSFYASTNLSFEEAFHLPDSALVGTTDRLALHANG